MTELEVPLSASKLKTFGECPERFRQKYIERNEPEGSDNRYIRRGNAVHEAIELVLPDYDGEWDRDLLAFEFREAYRRNGGQEGYTLSDDDAEFVKECLETAAKYTAKREPDIVAVEAEVPFYSEQIGHHFSGYADVVTDAEVWDWKTGSSEDKGMDEQLQGATYLAGFMQHMGYVPDAVRFAYLKEGKVKSIEPSDKLWTLVTQKANQLLTAVDAGEFPADPGESKCYWCDFEASCSASPVGGGGIDWRNYP